MSNLINLTDNAKSHLAELVSEHNKAYVRLEVKGGGCAGFKYDWKFEDKADDDFGDFNQLAPSSDFDTDAGTITRSSKMNDMDDSDDFDPNNEVPF